jgi:hypothetical protein
MFSWICPRCGREVPPSETECPNCKGAEAAAPAAAPPQPVYQTAPPQPTAYPPPPPGYPPAPPQPVYQAPPPQPIYQAPPRQDAPYQATPQQPAYAPPPGYQPQPGYQAQPPYAPPYPVGPHRGRHLPTWLLSVLFAVGFVVLVGGIYWLVGRGGNGSTAASPSATVESPAAKPGAKTSPVQKYIEVSGIRFTEDAKKRILVKFNLTNHSDADLNGLTGNVTIWGRTQKSEEDAVGTFSFTTDVGPQATKDVSAPLTTKLKIYELPDWQNVTTDLQVTAPQ